MRIGLIVNGRLRSLSGAQLYDAQLVSWLYQEGDDVEVISLPEASFSKALANNLNRPASCPTYAGYDSDGNYHNI